MTSLRRSALTVTILLLAGFAAACGGNAGPKTAADCPPADANKLKYVPNGDEGSYSGQVLLQGEYKPALLDMSNDAACANRNKQAVSDEVVAKDGKLQNAFIFIKEGSTTDLKKLSDFSFPLPAEEVEIDQLGCTYSPHVAGVRAGQKVTFTNSDQTVHNVNAQPKTNEKFNQSQAAGAPPITKTFCQPEQAVKVKCNQHGWMSAWVNVMSHPFFAVSDANGAFAIKGIPPGRYTVVVWHEKFGEKVGELSLAPKGKLEAKITFDAAQSSAASSSTLGLSVLELNSFSH